MRVMITFLFTTREWSNISALAVRFVNSASMAMAAVSEVEDIFQEELDAERLSHP